ncbi:MAG: RPA family protein [Haloplanus sp.]
MSAEDDGPGRREVAHRLFAAEFDDATVSYAESDEERAPKYVVTPTGARVNRLFAVGVLTEVESVNEDVLRARVVDPTGAFVSYAGQYQPDAAAFFERTEPPAFVALTGKARTFEPDDGDRIYTSVRPESVAEVDAETRDRWTVSAAEATLRRVAAMADAKSLDAGADDLRDALEARGYDASLAAGIPIALDRYGTTTAYLDAVREVALDALEVVAGERDAVRALDTAPADAGTASLGPLPDAVTAPSTEQEPTAVAPEATTDDAGTPADTTTPDTRPSAAGSETETASAEEPTGETTTDETTTDETTTEREPSDAGAAATAADETADTAGPATTEETATDESSETPDDDLGDFDDDDLYELDEEERREVEESFDVGFESGAEVDDPGEAGIDVPGPEVLDADAEAESPAEATGGEGTTGSEGGVADLDDVDLEAAAVETMDDLDEGDGADRDAVVAAVVEEYGADPGAVADAIEDALMSGKCYEPSEDRLKAI